MRKRAMGTLVAGSRRPGKSARAEWFIPLVTLVLLVIALAGVAYVDGLPMSAFVVAVSTWLHTLSTVVWIGYFLFTGLIYLPVLERQTQPHTGLPGLARWVGALFGPVLIVMFVGLDSLLKSKDPVFGYAVVLLDKPLTFYILLALPYVLLGLGLLMLVFTMLAWVRRYWSLLGRLHYTLLAASGLSVIWGMWYWNLLF